jgi:hypothetical protein
MCFSYKPVVQLLCKYTRMFIITNKELHIVASKQGFQHLRPAKFPRVSSSPSEYS